MWAAHVVGAAREQAQNRAEMNEPRRGRPSRSRLTVVIVAIPVLLVAAGLASRPDAAGPLPPGTTEPLRVALDSVFILLLAFAVFMIAAIIWSMWGPSTPVLGEVPKRPSWFVRYAAIPLLVVIAYVLYRNMHAGSAPGGILAILDQIRGHPAGTRNLPPGQAAGFDWAALLIASAIIAAAAWTLHRELFRRSGAVPQPRQVADPGPDAAAMVQEVITDLRAEPDPRRAVIAAYARMERVLAARGAARRPSEAPLEYMSRALNSLSARAPEIRRLTALFEVARFSIRPVDQTMKGEAIAALESIRDGLTSPPA